METVVQSISLILILSFFTSRQASEMTLPPLPGWATFTESIFLTFLSLGIYWIVYIRKCLECKSCTTKGNEWWAWRYSSPLHPLTHLTFPLFLISTVPYLIWPPMADIHCFYHQFFFLWWAWEHSIPLTLLTIQALHLCLTHCLLCFSHPHHIQPPYCFHLFHNFCLQKHVCIYSGHSLFWFLFFNFQYAYICWSSTMMGLLGGVGRHYHKSTIISIIKGITVTHNGIISNQNK